MTITGRAAEQRPDINDLNPVRYGLVTHAVRVNGVGGRAWVTAGPGRPDLGDADPETGAYRTAAGAMTETERRQAGLRRNGQLRRKASN